ncbi:hypothetical protein [Mucilaginibacter myungsuensis]|uniref:Uncharacterized protein n=1 Tax=Mucilaginibacter myungsuensis TaxID=649104 RepID=A0A929KVG1_9SPHI|nr:hypothetical protein [Mucilaginibacter myungsuensis]MBE9661168.1 hypothetical protein [Mucilaginibacter myungsuensis]MDN3597313.1 hypothetical protein [Mucilaginibacter myungsuensis]
MVFVMAIISFWITSANEETGALPVIAPIFIAIFQALSFPVDVFDLDGFAMFFLGLFFGCSFWICLIEALFVIAIRLRNNN